MVKYQLLESTLVYYHSWFPLTMYCFLWHCCCSRMPQAWESAHFIIQWLPLLNFCFLQCPLPLKAKDCLNTFSPTGRAARTVSPEAMVHNSVYLSAPELLAPSAADQGGHFHDILLGGCPQNNGLVVLSQASVSLRISTRMYDHHSALTACISILA